MKLEDVQDDFLLIMKGFVYLSAWAFVMIALGIFVKVAKILFMMGFNIL